MKPDLSSTDNARHEVEPAGRLEARYLAFLETIAHLRPSLHRYCARMTGSVLDGEDVVQEALFQAYRKLDTFDEARPLAPWLFRIAHNRCIDFLRRKGIREQAEVEAASAEADSTPPVEPVGPALGKAVEHLVVMLPPKERTCVLLKDVFDYSLEEIADLVDSTVGGVKAALNRGRAKLAERPAGSPLVRAQTSDDRRCFGCTSSDSTSAIGMVFGSSSPPPPACCWPTGSSGASPMRRTLLPTSACRRRGGFRSAKSMGKPRSSFSRKTAKGGS